MTARQSLKLFEIPNRYFQSENYVRSFVEEIETVVDNKFKVERDLFAPSSSIDELDSKIELLRKDMQIGFAELKSELRAGFNRQRIWLVGVMFALAGIIIAFIKLLF